MNRAGDRHQGRELEGPCVWICYKP